jgi:transcription termination/antitermination protein NusG
MHEPFQAQLTHSEPIEAAYQTSWFAVQTKPRHEKRVTAELEEKGVAVFLPLFSALHQWSDRRREVQLPLFSNYAFVRISEDRTARVTVLRTNGVRGFVGARGIGVPIPNEQIDAVQTILKEKVPFTLYPFLSIGQKVRIRGGSLDGIQGILSTVNDDRSLIVSVEGVQRSLAIRIDGYGVEPI